MTIRGGGALRLKSEDEASTAEEETMDSGEEESVWLMVEE